MTQIRHAVSRLANHQYFFGAIFGGMAIIAASIMLCFPNASPLKARPTHPEFDRHCGRICVYNGDTGFVLTRQGLIMMVSESAPPGL